jgi:hypothetical protein
MGLRMALGLLAVLHGAACSGTRTPDGPPPPAPTARAEGGGCAERLGARMDADTALAVGVLLDVPAEQVAADFCRGLAMAVEDGRLKPEDLLNGGGPEDELRDPGAYRLLRAVRTSLAGAPSENVLGQVPVVVPRATLARCIDQLGGRDPERTVNALALMFNVPRGDALNLMCRLIFVALERNVLAADAVEGRSNGSRALEQLIPPLRKLLTQLSKETYI